MMNRVLSLMLVGMVVLAGCSAQPAKKIEGKWVLNEQKSKDELKKKAEELKENAKPDPENPMAQIEQMKGPLAAAMMLQAMTGATLEFTGSEMTISAPKGSKSMKYEVVDTADNGVTLKFENGEKTSFMFRDGNLAMPIETIKDEKDGLFIYFKRAE